MWTLVDFIPRFDEWVEREDPPVDWRYVVLEWIHSLQADPYRGATRALDLGPAWWFARIPDADDGEKAAVCTYRIREDDETVTCSAITVLRHPIV